MVRVLFLAGLLASPAAAADPDFRDAYQREQSPNKQALTTRLAMCYRQSTLAIDQGAISTLGGLFDNLAQAQKREKVHCVLHEVEPAVNRWLCASLPGKREDAAGPAGKEVFLEVAAALEKAAGPPIMPRAAPKSPGNRLHKPPGEKPPKLKFDPTRRPQELDDQAEDYRVFTKGEHHVTTTQSASHRPRSTAGRANPGEGGRGPRAEPCRCGLGGDYRRNPPDNRRAVQGRRCDGNTVRRTGVRKPPGSERA